LHCHSCGRDLEGHACIHHTSFSTKDQLFIMLLVIAFPSMLYGIFFNIVGSYDNIDYLFVGSILISTILIIFLIAYYAFDKLYLVLFFGCHQRVERSLMFFKKPFVLCSRCTGIMVGMFLTIFLTLFEFNYWYILLFVIPVIIDGVIQKYTSYVSNNFKRFITGLLSGPTFVLLFGFLHYIISSTITNLALELIKST
jgi:uncharacterized membrane protein